MTHDRDYAPSGNMPDEFDRQLGALDGLPDVVGTKASTVRTVTPLLGYAETFIVQTFRQVGKGDTIFIEHVGRGGTVRMVVPARVADAIARQREALTAKTRSKAAKAQAEERRLRGELPAFASGRRAS